MENDAPKLEMINARLSRGTGERIDKVLYGGELRSAFIRMAIETELLKREDARRRTRRVRHVKEMQAAG